MASPGSQTLDPDQRSDVFLARARSKRLPKTNSAYDNVASWQILLQKSKVATHHAAAGAVTADDAVAG
jgi:hypothetical protein